jgi:tetratricopeptide (TPR) repeat protein
MKTTSTTSAPASTNFPPFANLQGIAHTVFIAFLFAFALPVFAQQQKIDSLLKVLQSTKADTSRVKLLHRISIEYPSSNNDKAMEYAKLGLALSGKIGFKKGQIACLYTLGLAYYNIGNFDTAMVYFEKRLTIAKKMKDSASIASTCRGMGNIYLHHGDHKRAIDMEKRRTRFMPHVMKKIY